MSPLWGFWPQILPQTADFVILRKGYFIKLNYFPFPRVRNLSQKIENAAPALTPSPLPLRPSNDICITFTLTDDWIFTFKQWHRYSELILPVPWLFVTLRFHRKTCTVCNKIITWWVIEFTDTIESFFSPFLTWNYFRDLVVKDVQNKTIVCNVTCTKEHNDLVSVRLCRLLGKSLNMGEGS